MTTTTTRYSLKVLAKSILGKLENRKAIEFNPKERSELLESFEKRLARLIITEEDLNEQVRGQVGKVSDALTDSNMTETEAFQSQKRALKSKLSDNMIQGFYLKAALRDVVADARKFLFDSSLVDDVFESDDVLDKMIRETIQTFDETKIS
jgi:hypothetical protein